MAGGEGVSARNKRELLTLATILDALLSGSLGRVGDVAMGRLQAIESAHRDGRWEMARHLEAIPLEEVGASNLRDQEVAICAELRRAKLREALEKLKATGGARASAGSRG